MLRNLLLTVMAVLPLAAQEKLVETIEVRVVNVDVVVTDRDGKPVSGLTRNDFEILEERRAQTITHFYEVRGGAPVETAKAADAPPVLHPRSFILFIDNRSMHPVLLRRVGAELTRLVDTQMKPGDRATVASWTDSLTIHTPLTGDKDALRAAIETVSKSGSAASTSSESQRVQQQCTRSLNHALTGRMLMRMAYEECIADARIEAQRLTTLSRLILNAVNVVMTTVAGVDGKKVLVMAGTELPVRPGHDIYQWANTQFGRYMTGFDAAIQQPRDEEQAQRDMLKQLARSANAQGVTLYMLSVLMPTDTYGAKSATGTDGAGDFLRAINTDVSHETLAKLTGGAALPLAGVEKMLDTLRSDLDSYYSLGYQPAGDVKGERAITVRAKNRAYTVRARQTYAQKSLDEQAADRVVANIYTPARENEWPVQVRTGEPRVLDKGVWSVPIEIVAPATLTLLPQGNELAGGFTVFVAVGNSQGMLSTTFRQPNGIRIKNEEEAGFRNEPLVFTATLTVREGENLISVGLLDQVANTMGFARTTVTATR